MKSSLFKTFILVLITATLLPAQNQIQIEEPAEFEAAKALAVDFQKVFQPLQVKDIDQVFLRYSIYTRAAGVTAKLNFSLFLRSVPEKDHLYHAGFVLGGVEGKGFFDKFLISVGRIFIKVPDTKRQLRINTRLDENGRFRTVEYWEVPHFKFVKKWQRLLEKETKIRNYISQNEQEKAKKLELQVKRDKELLWSPFIVQFDGNPNHVIRFKKNNMDEKASWEKQTIPYSNQTDLFTAILHHFLTGGRDEKKTVPVVFLYKKADQSPEGQRKPIFVLEELRLKIQPLEGTEAENQYPCNQKLVIQGEGELPGLFDHPIYLKKEPGGGNVPSLIYIGDILVGKKEKVELGQMRAYLTDVSILSRIPNKPEEKTR